MAGALALVPPGAVTVTLTVPGPVPAGAVAVIWTAELTVKLMAGVVPNLTAVAPVKLTPATTTDVPPMTGPLAGERPVTVTEDV